MFSVIENSVNLDTVNFDALYLVKLIFGKYFMLFRRESHCRFTAITLAIGRDLRSRARES